MVSLPQLSDAPDDQAGGGCGSCSSGEGDSRCGNGLEKVYRTTAVRYGYMKNVGEFNRPENMIFSCGAKVVIQTQRGIEIGEQVSLGCSGCSKHVSRDQIKEYVRNSSAGTYQLDHGRILREATPDDLTEGVHLRDRTPGMKSFAQKRAGDLSLKMKIIECEYLLGGDRAIFYFMSDGRIDFRDLVKDLSREFQTRIKMQQVGARDEARLLADFETCGREVCCKVFLKTLKPITMRMAKLQRSTLDPSKVSGRCGRLKCCLRYEHESYESLDSALPRVGEKIETEHGFGTVVKRQVLTQLVEIAQVADAGKVTVVIEDVIQRNLESLPAPPPPPEPRARSTASQGGPRPTKRPTRPQKSKSDGDRSKADARPEKPASADAPAESKTEPPTDGSKRRGRRRRRRGGRRGGPAGPSSPDQAS